MATYPLSGLVIERSGDVDGPGHVLHGERAPKVAPSDFVSDSRSCRAKCAIRHKQSSKMQVTSHHFLNKVTKSKSVKSPLPDPSLIR